MAAAAPLLPDRPLDEHTCAEAMARAIEAGMMSPTLTKAQNARLFAEARARARRLCARAVNE